MQSNLFSEGNLKNPQYLIIGTKCIDDNISDRLYSGPSGIYFRKLLVSNDFTKNNTLLIYINEFNLESIIDHIIYSKPTCLLILGQDSVKYMNLTMSNNYKYRGLIYEYLYINSVGDSDMFSDRYCMRLPNILTYHPYYIFQQKNIEFVNILKTTLANDLSLFKITGAQLRNKLLISNMI